jgi:hypothetical protein
MYELNGDPAGRSHFYDVMRQFQSNRGRGSVSSKPGAPELDRTRGISDKPKGSSKGKRKATTDGSTNKRTKTTTQSSIRSDRSSIFDATGVHGGGVAAQQTLKPAQHFDESDAAQRYLKKNGAHEGWILELFLNDKFVPTPLPTDRWFMVVEDGRAIRTASGETEIAKCRWMKTNSYTELDTAFKNAYPVDIESVKACGPPSAFAPLRKRVMVNGAAFIGSQ